MNKILITICVFYCFFIFPAHAGMLKVSHDESHVEIIDITTVSEESTMLNDGTIVTETVSTDETTIIEDTPSGIVVDTIVDQRIDVEID